MQGYNAATVAMMTGSMTDRRTGKRVPVDMRNAEHADIGCAFFFVLSDDDSVGAIEAGRVRVSTAIEFPTSRYGAYRPGKA